MPAEIVRAKPDIERFVLLIAKALLVAMALFAVVLYPIPFQAKAIPRVLVIVASNVELTTMIAMHESLQELEKDSGCDQA